VGDPPPPARQHGFLDERACNLPSLFALLPAVNVYLPKDRVTNAHQGYGFVEFRSEEDADYVSPGGGSDRSGSSQGLLTCMGAPCALARGLHGGMQRQWACVIGGGGCMHACTSQR
jgi:hypothetical protein